TRPTTPTSRTKRSQSGSFSVFIVVTPSWRGKIGWPAPRAAFSSSEASAPTARPECMSTNRRSLADRLRRRPCSQPLRRCRGRGRSSRTQPVCLELILRLLYVVHAALYRCVHAGGGVERRSAVDLAAACNIEVGR